MSYKKVIFALLFLAIFGFLFNLGAPTAKAAMTVEEMQALIKQLQAQIAELQKQTVETSTPEKPVVWCYDFHLSLKYGMGGTEVRALQTALQKEGFYEKAISGTFDEYTASAVTGFQEKYKEDILTPWDLIYGTGYAGKTTLAKLNELYGCKEEEVPETCHTTSLWSWNYCSPTCKCDTGEGDCDKNTDCNTGYCAYNVGAKYGQVSTMDVCEEKEEKSITVTSPNGGEEWIAGQTYDITWDTNLTVASELVGIEGLTIFLSKDGSGYYRGITRGIDPARRKYSWTIPTNIPSRDYKIVITSTISSASGIKDASDNYFSIAGAETCHTSSLWSWDYCSLTCKCDAGEGDCDTDADCTTGYCAKNVGAKYGQVSGMDVCEEKVEKVEVNITGGGYFSVKTGETAIINQFCLTNQSSKETAEILNFEIGNEGANDFINYFEEDSYGLYTTTGAEVKVASLKNTGALGSYASYLIFDLSQSIQLSPSVTQCYNLKAKVKSTVPNDSTIVYLAQVMGLTGTGASITSSDWAKGNVNIQKAKFITVISPDGGEKWAVGNTYDIKWEFRDIDYIYINYVDYSGGVRYAGWIADKISASLRKYSWRIPEGLSGNYFKIYLFAYNSQPSPIATDESDNYFSIVSETCHISSLWSWDYCSPTCKCDAGEGDCDYDADCNTGYCAYSVGAKYGQVSGMDVCEEKSVVTCTDTDGGKDYYVAGSVSACEVDGPCVIPVPDVCIDEFTLEEQYCQNGNMLSEKYKCPNGCKDGACLKEEKFITVNYPNGGEIWMKGHVYSPSITWSSTGINKINIELYSLSFKRKIATAVAASLGKYSWAIPDDVPAGDEYTVILTEYSTYSLPETITDSSDNNFSIVDGFSITNVVGVKSSYAPGEKISLTFKGIEPDGTSALPSEGFGVQSYIFDSPRTKTVAGVNGSYNSGTGLWNVEITAPSDQSVSYDHTVSLYCSRDDSVCATKYGRAAQVEKLFQFTLSPAEITCTDSDGGKDYYVKGKTAGISPSTGEYYHGEDVCYTGPENYYKKGQLVEHYCDGKYHTNLAYTCPYGCQDGACLKETSKPDLTVTDITWAPLNPLVGDAITFYSTIQNIGTKEVPGGSNYRVCDYIDGVKTNCNSYGGSLGKETQTITWSKTPNWPDSFSVGDHTFKVVADDSKVVDEILEDNNSLTKTFTVSEEKSITVLSPNGGETWVKGNTYDIVWQSAGVENVHIDVVNSIGRTLTSGYVPASTGKYSWTIGAKWPDLPTGDTYKVRVFTYPLPPSGGWEEGVNYDQSDNYFSIVEAAPVGLKYIENQLAAIAEIIFQIGERIKELIGR